MDVFAILKLIGGIGLFLYGMKYLGASLEHLAGARLEKTLEKLTDSRVKGLSLGVLVTAVIQSSAATTIMLVGFANAGIMRLAQTVPVLLGANIGTTMTGQILRLGDISSSGSFIFDLLKPSSFAPLFIGIAAFIMLMSKSKKANNIASIMMGFGILFFGMNTMETALEPLKSSASFREMFTTFNNPIIGLLLGILLSAILQSSSAAVGIVQAVAAATGTVTFAVAAPMIMGISVGKLLPIVLASIGTKREAKQVALSQFLISAIGATGGMLILYLVLSPLNLVTWDTVMNRGNIADVNTVFNIIVSICLLPFTGFIAKLAKKIIRDDQPTKLDQELTMLDDRFLKTPAVALGQCRNVINSMGATAVENLSLAIGMHDLFTESNIEKINENELFLDKSETILSDYMVKVNSCILNAEEQKLATEIIHSIMDFERIGDHCVKIFEVAEFNNSSKIVFSNTAKKELGILFDAVSETMRITVESFTTDNDVLAQNVEPLEELTKALAENVKQRHIKRLQAGSCTVQSGISLIECLTSLERISAYCSNIALHVIERHYDGNFDMHEYANRMHTSSTVYKNLYDMYSKKYLDPLEKIIVLPVTK